MKMALIAICVFAGAVGGSLAVADGQDGPVKVVIQEDKTEVAEQALAIDPIIRVAYEYVGGMSFGINCAGKPFTCASRQWHQHLQDRRQGEHAHW